MPPPTRLKHAAVIGGIAGGCALPLLIFTFCALILGDTGGPLFWPAISIPLTLLGIFIGSLIRSRSKFKP